MADTSTGTFLARGVVAGIGGTVVMTAFQKLVEMPLTKRPESYAGRVRPADHADLDEHRRGAPAAELRHALRPRRHVGETAYGIAAKAGLRGQKAVHAVFGVVYVGDVVLNTALGLYEPRSWTRKDLVVDVVDKYVQAQATGAIFDRLLDPEG